MPQFAFTARDPAGQKQLGVQEAESPGDLVTRLRGRGWIVVDVRQSRTGAQILGPWLRSLNPHRWLPATRLDVELGLLQVATMLRSGLTLLTSLRTAAEQVRRPAMTLVWRRVYERIEAGSSFADSLSAEGRRFPSMIIQLVRVGEQTGTLDAVLTRGAEHLERSRALRTRLLTALMYPAFVLLAAVGVATFMVVGVIPKLKRFIEMRGRRLPPITQLLLDLTAWFHRNGTWLALGWAGGFLLLFVLYQTRGGRLQIDRFMLRVPLLGGLLRLAGTTTAARGLSVLLESGITLLGALETTGGLLSNRMLRLRVERARQTVMQGGTLADGLGAGREFLPMLGRMSAVGEATGTLDTVLAEVARFHEERLAAAVRRFSALVEPAVILVVGAIVGFVYIAFFVALFSIAGGK